MRRLLALLVPILLLVLLPASSASAVAPVRVPLRADDFTLEGRCDFDVFIHFVENEEFITTYFDEDGNPIRQTITGLLVIEATNLDTGTSIVYNVSGPAFITFLEDGSTDFAFGGRSLLSFLPGDVEDLPLLFVNSGLVITRVDAEGNVVGVEQVGDVEDVCASLS